MKALERSFRKPIDKIKFADKIQTSEGLTQWLNSPVLSLFEVEDGEVVGDNSIYS